MDGLVRGFIHRRGNLPNSILSLTSIKITKISDDFQDGRVNSSINEEKTLSLLIEKFGKRIKVPKSRMWYDFLILDFRYGWLPVNIKITNMKGNDNVCNLAGLVHTYTDEILDFETFYKNGDMAKILTKKIKSGKVNTLQKKDYYFLIVDKTNLNIYVNSLTGISEMKSNVNNLPFQVNWGRNKVYNPKSVKKSIEMFVNLYEDIKVSWRDDFIKNMKDKGQFFTKNKLLQDNVKKFVKNNEGSILEPSIGRGDLISIFKDRTFEMYEIDSNIEFLEDIDTSRVIFGDFLQQNITKKFKTIVGNPPYVKMTDGNLYIKFVEKCFDLLDKGGELVFIVPSDFFKVTGASKILKKMCKDGYFSDVFHPNNEKLFENASVDVIIFRYEKTIKSYPVIMSFNDTVMYLHENNGIVTFSNTDEKYVLLHQNFDVKVGIVSGCDKVYRTPIGNVDIMIGENIIEKYIMIDEFPSENSEIDEHLQDNKDLLLCRKIKKFNADNWYQWGALRNIKFINENLGKRCIYMFNLTRRKRVAFIGNVQLFGSNLLMIVPKVENIDLGMVVEYMNSENYRRNYTFSDRYKIGQKQLMNSLVTKF